MEQKETDMPLGELIIAKAQLYGDHTAMVCSVTGKEWTYKDLATQALRLSGGLEQLGVQKGDVVCIVCHNCPEYTVFCLAVLLCGAVVSTANPAFTAAELQRQLNNSCAKFVFCGSTNAKVVMTAVSGSAVKNVIALGDTAGCVAYHTLMNMKNIVQKSKPQIDAKSDLAFLPYSSGTTGLPKGVMLTHYNVISNMIQFSNPVIQTESPDVDQEVYIAALPLFHVFGLLSVQMYGLYRGHRIVYMPKFSLANYLKVITQFKATILHIVPPIVLMMLKETQLTSQCDFTSVHLAYCGAAPLGTDTEQIFLEKTGIKTFKQGYGMTEAGPVLTVAKHVNWKPGSVGIPVPGTDAKVLDINSGEILPPGCHGELCFRGPQIMTGYWKNPDATKSTLDRKGWLHTGDIGYRDTEGNFYVTDRLKELIKYKAHQVAPAELESLLLRHRDVQDAAVVGIPDPIAGELPLACIVKKHGSDVSKIELMNFVKENAAPHKQLRGGVRFMNSIPKSPSGKILRRILKNNLNKSKL